LDRKRRKEKEMKRMIAVFTAAAIGALIIMTGCGKEGPSDIDMDESAIRSFIESDTLWFNTSRHFEGEATDDSGGTSGDYGRVPHGSPGPLGEIAPLLWGRQILGHPDPQVIIDVVGDSAYVAWEIHNTGFFNIFAWDPDSGQSGEWVFIKKELNETARISAVFKRTGNHGDPYRGWDLSAISGAWGTSEPNRTVTIDSLRIQCATHPDTVFSTPLGITPILQTLTFAPGETVTLTLYANVPDAKVFLHVFRNIWPFHIRVPFTYNNEDGSYTGTWNAEIIPAVRIAVFDCMHKNTLDDDAYQYDYNGWLFFYLVHP
jgi:hypothetical protein